MSLYPYTKGPKAHKAVKKINKASAKKKAERKYKKKSGVKKSSTKKRRHTTSGRGTRLAVYLRR